MATDRKYIVTVKKVSYLTLTVEDAMGREDAELLARVRAPNTPDLWNEGSPIVVASTEI